MNEREEKNSDKKNRINSSYYSVNIQFSLRETI